jgi:hypothetical protein
MLFVPLVYLPADESAEAVLLHPGDRSADLHLDAQAAAELEMQPGEVPPAVDGDAGKIIRDSNLVIVSFADAWEGSLYCPRDLQQTIQNPQSRISITSCLTFTQFLASLWGAV